MYLSNTALISYTKMLIMKYRMLVNQGSSVLIESLSVYKHDERGGGGFQGIVFFLWRGIGWRPVLV